MRRVTCSIDAIAVIRCAARPDKIESIFPRLFSGDVLRLVPISFQDHAALLHHDRAVLLFLVKSDSRFIAAHMTSFLVEPPDAGPTVGNFLSFDSSKF